MNFIALESAQKLRGGFYTEPQIARYLIDWVKAGKPSSILEPSCGDGVFLEAAYKARIPGLKQVTAFEIDSAEAQKAANRTRLRADVKNEDFLRWYLFHGQNKFFDGVVGNPPFIRYQYLAREQQALAEKIFEQLRLPFTKHTNAWVPFVLAGIRLLRPGGRLAMVVPSELFHIPHAQSLRRYLAEQCSRTLLVDPEEIWFSETLQGTVLLLAQKKESPAEKSFGVAVVPAKSRDILSKPAEVFFQDSTYTNGATIEGKWMPVLLTKHERDLIAELRCLPSVRKFSEIASVDVGIVTGANKFFLVPRAIVTEHRLERWAHPMFGRSDHVKGLIYSNEDHEANDYSGMPSNFLWFDEEKIEKLPANVLKYLDLGINQELHTRYKCRVRRPWYKVPSVYSAPIAMLKRAHHYPRLVLNSAGAYTTDTAYRIRPIGIKPEALVAGFINSLTCLCAEMEGRHYGGGVLELVPSEIERLLIPVINFGKRELKSADTRFRNSPDDSDFLQSQDSVVLGKLGISSADQQMLHSAWIKLRDRRHRIQSDEQEP